MEDVAGMDRHSEYKRVLLKLSGELLMGKEPFGIDFSSCKKIARSLAALRKKEKEIAIVVGGGNIFRGINLSQTGMSRSGADQIGMLATLINGKALEQALSDCGCSATVVSALECPAVAEGYSRKKVERLLKSGEVVIFVGGTGNPYFTTDTAAVLRANEIDADILLKATKVNGVYDKDPHLYPDAKKFDTITFKEALEKELKVMDATAFALCRSESMPLYIFNMERLFDLSIEEILADRNHGTLVMSSCSIQLSK